MGTDCCQTRFPFKSLGKHHAYDNSVEKTRIRVGISSMKVQKIARANLVTNVIIFGSRSTSERFSFRRVWNSSLDTVVWRVKQKTHKWWFHLYQIVNGFLDEGLLDSEVSS